MIAALVFLRSGGAIVAGWFFGDWRRLAALLVALGFLATYVIGDARGRAAEAAKSDQKIADITTMFTKASADAVDREKKRQADIGAAVEADFEKQMAVRDAADARASIALEQEIADHAKKPVDPNCDRGTVCPDDLEWLQPHAAAP